MDDSGSSGPGVPAAIRSGDWLCQLESGEFTRLVAHAYRTHGFQVTAPPSGADSGVELVLTRGAERYVVQCRHWKARIVGAPVIREAYGLVMAHGATGGVVVTAGSFSRGARDFAHRFGIQLVGGSATAELVASGRLPGTGPLEALVPHRLRVEASRQFEPSPAGARSAPGRHSRRPLIVATSILAPLLMLSLGLSIANQLVGLVNRVSLPSGAESPSPNTPVTIAVGEQPMAIAIDPAAGRGYTANFVSGDVTVIDLARQAVIKTIDVAGKPSAIAVDPGPGVLWVADFDAARVRAIDLRTGAEVAAVKVRAQPSALTVDPTRSRLYVTSRGSDDIEVFDSTTRRRLSRIEAEAPGGIAVDTVAQVLYVPQCESGFVYDYNLRQRRWGDQFFASRYPISLAMDSERHRLYASSGRQLQEVNRVTGHVRRIPSPVEAQGVGVDEIGRAAYLVDAAANSVVVINLT